MKQINLVAVRCGVSDRGAPKIPAQAGHPCSELQSILVKTDVSFTILINDLQGKNRFISVICRGVAKASHKKRDYLTHARSLRSLETQSYQRETISLFYS